MHGLYAEPGAEGSPDEGPEDPEEDIGGSGNAAVVVAKPTNHYAHSPFWLW